MIRKLPTSALWVMGFLLFLSVFRDVLANGRPLYCRIGGEAYYPGLRSIFYPENKRFESEALLKIQYQTNQFDVWKDSKNFDSPPIYAPIPFSPGEYSTLNVSRFAKPGSAHQGLEKRFVHWLGTDATGFDIAATLVSGARIAVLTGALAMTVALVIGLSLGMLAGFFGDDRLRIKTIYFWMFFLGFPVAWFLAITTRAYTLSNAGGQWELFKSVWIFLLVMFLFNRLAWLIGRHPRFSKQMLFPADLIIMRIAEVFAAMPTLIIVIVLALALRDVIDASIWLMISLIGAFGWTGVAKLVRAELLKVRTLDYVTAARGLGMSEWRVMMQHALPNTLRPIYIAFAFGAAGAVMLEAYLSFLGYGGQSFRGMSWGSLFINENSASNPLMTWWVTLFPGLMIFITVFSLNRIGDALSEQ